MSICKYVLATAVAGSAMLAGGCKGPLQSDGPAPRASSVVAPDNAGLAPRRSPVPVGSPAPPFVLVDQKGNRVSSAELTSKAASVVVFMPPRTEPGARPVFEWARRHRLLLAQRGMELIVISPNSQQDNAVMADGESLRVGVLSDPASWVARAYGTVPEDKPAPTAPHTFVLGTDGRIQFSENGLPDPAQAIIAGEAMPGRKTKGVFY